MKEQTTIILELTPREAAAIEEMALMCSWENGSYKEEVCSIYRALESVRHEFSEHRTVTKTKFGEVDTGLWWIDDNDEWPQPRRIDE